MSTDFCIAHTKRGRGMLASICLGKNVLVVYWECLPAAPHRLPHYVWYLPTEGRVYCVCSIFNRFSWKLSCYTHVY